MEATEAMVTVDTVMATLVVTEGTDMATQVTEDTVMATQVTEDMVMDIQPMVTEDTGKTCWKIRSYIYISRVVSFSDMKAITTITLLTIIITCSESIDRASE